MKGCKRSFSTQIIKLWRAQPAHLTYPVLSSCGTAHLEDKFNTSVTINDGSNKHFSCLKDSSLAPHKEEEYNDLLIDQLKGICQFDNNYFVGSEWQYPILSNINVMKLFNQFCQASMPLSYYLVSDEMKEYCKFEMESLIDYYPFINNKSVNEWELSEIGYPFSFGISDNESSNVPYLRRNSNSSNEKQEIIIWRDIHGQMLNLQRVEKLLNDYKPDILLVENPPSGFLNMVHQYMNRPNLKNIANFHTCTTCNAIKLYRKLISSFIDDKLKRDKMSRSMELNLGSIFQSGYSYNYSLHPCIKYANKNEKKCKMIFMDMLSEYILNTLAFVNMFDFFQNAMLTANCDIDILASNVIDPLFFLHYLPLDVSYKIMCQTQPHFCVMNELRNDLMKATIDQVASNNDCKKMFVMVGGHHTQPLIDRLTNSNNNNATNENNAILQVLDQNDNICNDNVSTLLKNGTVDDFKVRLEGPFNLHDNFLSQKPLMINDDDLNTFEKVLDRKEMKYVETIQSLSEEQHQFYQKVQNIKLQDFRLKCD